MRKAVAVRRLRNLGMPVGVEGITHRVEFGAAYRVAVSYPGYRVPPNRYFWANSGLHRGEAAEPPLILPAQSTKIDKINPTFTYTNLLFFLSNTGNDEPAEGVN